MIAADNIRMMAIAIPHDSFSSIFSFKDFSTAVALLLVLYTVTDFRSRFRQSIAPVYLVHITFYMIPIIGILLISTDLFINTSMFATEFNFFINLWQSILALLMLIPVLIWVYFSYISPPVFSKANYKFYASALYKAILKGSDNELRIIADELRFSIQSLLTYSTVDAKQSANKKKPQNARQEINGYAQDVLLLIADRKMCRYIVISAPGTAIAFFQELKSNDRVNIPIAKVACGLAYEAVLCPDSMLHNEDEIYNHGLVGTMQTLGKSIFGNYTLIERLSRLGLSPLDIRTPDILRLNTIQFRAYTSCILLTIKSYARNNNAGTIQHSISRAFDIVKMNLMGISRINTISSDIFTSEEYTKLSLAIQLASDSVIAISEIRIPEWLTYKEISRDTKNNIFDKIADLMCEIISEASYVTSNDNHWFIHQNTVWSGLFEPIEQSKAWSHVHHRLRRKLFDEITILDQHLSYKAARILGLCLNVLGFSPRNTKSSYASSYALHTAIVSWTKRNFLRILDSERDVAFACLVGTISFDEEKQRLVKTYRKFPGTPPHKEYLDLTPSI